MSKQGGTPVPKERWLLQEGSQSKKKEGEKIRESLDWGGGGGLDISPKKK